MWKHFTEGHDLLWRISRLLPAWSSKVNVERDNKIYSMKKPYSTCLLIFMVTTIYSLLGHFLIWTMEIEKLLISMFQNVVVSIMFFGFFYFKKLSRNTQADLSSLLWISLSPYGSYKALAQYMPIEYIYGYIFVLILIIAIDEFIHPYGEGSILELIKKLRNSEKKVDLPHSILKYFIPIVFLNKMFGETLWVLKEITKFTEWCVRDSL